jgi:hypothetical protein
VSHQIIIVCRVVPRGMRGCGRPGPSVPWSPTFSRSDQQCITNIYSVFSFDSHMIFSINNRFKLLGLRYTHTIYVSRLLLSPSGCRVAPPIRISLQMGLRHTTCHCVCDYCIIEREMCPWAISSCLVDWMLNTLSPTNNSTYEHEHMYLKRKIEKYRSILQILLN